MNKRNIKNIQNKNEIKSPISKTRSNPLTPKISKSKLNCMEIKIIKHKLFK